MASTSTNNFTAALERALKEHSLLQLNLYFSKTPNCSDVLNKANISMLMKILKRDRKHDNISIPVLCVLTCFERFLNSNIGVEIWQELSEDVSKLFDTTFILSAMYIEDSTLVERCTSLFTDIVEHSEQLADDSLKYMMKSLLKTATADKFASVRFEVVSFISVLLQKSSRELRREVVPSTINLLVKLSDTLVSCGNYELQATTVEVLARCRIYITDLQQSATVTLFPSNPRILDLFSNYTFLTFDSECRLFLNELNMSLATNKLVYSLPCMIIIVDNVQLRRPVDPLYTEFWVDFNSCPASISFYYLPPKGSLPDKETWDAFNIPFDCVTSVTAKKSQCRAKNSDSVVESVKLEIYRSTTPEHVKIYLVNDEHFETVETNILRKVLQDKYKSEIECTSDAKKPTQSTSQKPNKCQPEEINDILEDDWSLDVFHNPSSQDNKLLQATYKINDMVLVGKHCTSQVNTRLKKVHELAKKEREMNISAFDYNVQASISSVQTELKKLETATKTLASTKIALDSTFNLLKESALQLEADAAKIEHAKKELTKKLSQAEKTETSSINSIFQSVGRYMKNMVFSLLQSKQQNNRVIH